MATSATIISNIQQAWALGICNADIMQAARQYIAGFLVGNGAQSYSINGRILTFQTLEQAQKVYHYFSNAPEPGDSPYVSTFGHF